MRKKYIGDRQWQFVHRPRLKTRSRPSSTYNFESYNNLFNQKHFHFNHLLKKKYLYCFHWLLSVLIIVLLLFLLSVYRTFLYNIVFFMRNTPMVCCTSMTQNCKDRKNKFEMLTFRVNDVWKWFQDT